MSNLLFALALLCTGPAAAAVTCTPVELDNLRVFAFDGAYSAGGNTKTLNAASAALGAPQVACTYSGTPAGAITIEAVDAVTTSTVLASCTATASSGTATCSSIAVPARGSWIKLRARDTGGSNTVSANKFGVGWLGTYLGASNSLFSGKNGGGCTGVTADANTSIFDRDGAGGVWWLAMSNGGCGDIQYTKVLLQATGYVAGVAVYSQGGSGQSSDLCGQSVWNVFADPSAATSVNGPTAGPHIGSDLNFILFSPAANLDAATGFSTYLANMLLIQEQVYHASGGTLTTCNSSTPLTARNETTLGMGINIAFGDCTAAENASCGEGTTGKTNEQVDAIRRAVGTLVRDHAAQGFYSAGNLYDKGTVVGLPHYQRPEDNYGKIAVRAALGTAGKAGIAGYSALGPQIIAPVKDPNGNFIDLTFQHNGSATDLGVATPASSSVGSFGSGGGNSSASFAGVSLANDGNGAPNNVTGHFYFFRVCDGCTANDESMASGTIFPVSSITKLGTAKLRLNFASPFNATHLIQVDYGYGMIGGVRDDTGSVSNPTLIFDNDPKITNALDPNAPGKPLEPTIGMLAASLPVAATGGASRGPWAR